MSDEFAPLPPDDSFVNEPVPEDGSSVLPTEPVEQVQARRSLRRYRKSDIEVDEEEDDDGEVLVVSLKLRSAGRRKGADSDDGDSRKVNRFANKPAAAPAPPATTLPAGSQGTTNEHPTPAPAPLIGAPLMNMTPRVSQPFDNDYMRRHPLPWKGLAYAVLALAAIIIAYVYGRKTGYAAGVAANTGGATVYSHIPKLTTLWSRPMIAQLDAILTADQKGDLKVARQQATDLHREIPDSRDLSLYLATLQVRQGLYNDAEADVSKMLDAFTPAQEAAAVNANLGFGYSRRRDFDQAIAVFAEAAAADPFNPNHFQHWAEALRHKGQLQEAIDRFKQALARLPVGVPSATSQRQEIEYKICLAQIELGKDEEAKAAIDAHLKSVVLTGYWQLAAAAYALAHGDLTGGAMALQRAHASLTAEDYTALTNDYFFHTYADHKEVAALLPTDSPEERTLPFEAHMGYFIDP